MIRIAIHGGAGEIKTPPEQSREYEDALRGALDAGYSLLERGESALDSVQAAVESLEDSPLFNAGRGSVLNRRGRVEMEAGLMCGRARDAGAVTGLRKTKQPIALARIVMDATPHVLLSGVAAENMARIHGLELRSPDYFITDFRRRQWLAAHDRIQLDHAEGDDAPGPQTVGAAARDANGSLAAATSTGGMTNKVPGRIGDSPIPGAGFYADNRFCAVSATGTGEYFLRTQAAMRVAALMEYANHDLETACGIALDDLRELGGRGGFIAVDAQGGVVMPFNTSGMYRASRTPAGEFLSL